MSDVETHPVQTPGNSAGRIAKTVTKHKRFITIKLPYQQNVQQLTLIK